MGRWNLLAFIAMVARPFQADELRLPRIRLGGH